MASSELDWTVSHSCELDSTEGTTEEQEEKDSTEGTTEDEEVSMDADSTELTQEKFGSTIEAGPVASKIPTSEIIIHTIAVERSAPLADLPADMDAAFGQWLSGSGLAPSKH